MRRKYLFSQVATPLGKAPLRGRDMDRIAVYSPGEIVVEGERIISVGQEGSCDADEVIEFPGCTAIPGLVDAHNHLIFSGYREDEFELKLRGVSYQEIAKRGGGIKRTLSMTRAASKEQLYEETHQRALNILASGTTTTEAKSGYGLDFENEIKQLEVAHQLNSNLPLDVVPVFLGAHEIPPDMSKDSYIKLLTDELMPAVKERGLSSFFDIFCEEGVYSVKDMELLFARAKELGFGLRAHAEEFSRLGSVKVAVEYGAHSVDHLLHINDEDIELLASSNTTAVVMPTVSFFLRLDRYAPARKLIDAGAVVALGSDFNPGSSPVEGMFLPLWLAVFKMGLSMEEALTAATLNSAHVLGLAEDRGSLEEGKIADFIVLSVPDYRHIFYRPGNPHILKVYKKGREVVDFSSCLRL